MRKIILILSLIAPLSLSAKQISVEYKDLKYTIKQDNKKFVFKSSSTKKEYTIRNCNKAQFDIFWAKISSKKSDITSFNKLYKESPLKFKENNSKTLLINPHGPLGKHLVNVPNQLFTLDIHEKIKCSK